MRYTRIDEPVSGATTYIKNVGLRYGQDMFHIFFERRRVQPTDKQAPHVMLDGQSLESIGSGRAVAE